MRFTGIFFIGFLLYCAHSDNSFKYTLTRVDHDLPTVDPTPSLTSPYRRFKGLLSLEILLYFTHWDNIISCFWPKLIYSFTTSFFYKIKTPYDPCRRSHFNIKVFAKTNVLLILNVKWFLIQRDFGYVNYKFTCTSPPKRPPLNGRIFSSENVKNSFFQAITCF